MFAPKKKINRNISQQHQNTNKDEASPDKDRDMPKGKAWPSPYQCCTENDEKNKKDMQQCYEISCNTINHELAYIELIVDNPICSSLENANLSIEERTNRHGLSWFSLCR